MNKNIKNFAKSALKYLKNNCNAESVLKFANENKIALASSGAIATLAATTATIKYINNKKHAKLLFLSRFYERFARKNCTSCIFEEVADNVTVVHSSYGQNIKESNMTIVQNDLYDCLIIDRILSSGINNENTEEEINETHEIDHNVQNLGESRFPIEETEEAEEKDINGEESEHCDCEECEEIDENDDIFYQKFLIIFAPTCLSEEDMKKIDNMGVVGYIVVPNKDNLGDIDLYVERYPHAVVVCPETALPAVKSTLKHLPTINFEDIAITSVEQLLAERKMIVENLLSNSVACCECCNPEKEECKCGCGCCKDCKCGCNAGENNECNCKDGENCKCCSEPKKCSECKENECEKDKDGKICCCCCCQDCEECDEEELEECEECEDGYKNYIVEALNEYPASFAHSPFYSVFAFSPMDPLINYKLNNQKEEVKEPKAIKTYEYFYVVPSSIDMTSTLICHSSIVSNRTARAVLNEQHLEDDIYIVRYKEQLALLNEEYKKAKHAKDSKKALHVIKGTIKDVKNNRKDDNLVKKPNHARRTFCDWLSDITKKNGAVKALLKKSLFRLCSTEKEMKNRMADFLSAMSLNIFDFVRNDFVLSSEIPYCVIKALVSGNSSPIVNQTIVQSTLLAAAESLVPGSIVKAGKIEYEQYGDILKLHEEGEEDNEECEECEECGECADEEESEENNENENSVIDENEESDKEM